MSNTFSSSSSDPANHTLRSALHSPSNPVAGEPDPEKLFIDDMLKKYCGEFGWWQLRHFVLTNLAWVLEAFHSMIMIFADREPSWRCSDGAAGKGCSSAAGSVCGLESGSWEWIGGPRSSTVAEWGLVCGLKYRVGLVQALFFVGSMFGAGIFGHLSDSSLGRKGTLVIVSLLNAIFGCLTAVSPNYMTYVFFRLLTGFSTGGVGLCAFVLATEPIGPSKRGIAGMSTFYFFSGGTAILSGIAYIFQTWRSLYIATSIPSILFLILILPFVSESPRWYLVRGRTDYAMKIMRKIAITNGKHLPDNVSLALDNDNESNLNSNKTVETQDSITGSNSNIAVELQEAITDCNSNKTVERQEAIAGSIIDVVKSPKTRLRFLLALVINFCCTVVYYGLSLNVVNLKTNLYLNVLLNAVGEMPAFMLTAVLIDRFGRKPLAIGTQWFSGFFCIAGSLLGSTGIWKVVRMICGVLGIFGMAGTYNLLFIYLMELFPTVVRNAALGCVSLAAQMGAILAPFVVVLGGGLPFMVFGICGIFGGVLTFFLPETLNRPLYDTMAGMEGGENA